jgi:hypothetical protein
MKSIGKSQLVYQKKGKNEIILVTIRSGSGVRSALRKIREVGRVLTRQGEMEKNHRAEARPTADLQIGVTSVNHLVVALIAFRKVPMAVKLTKVLSVKVS